MNLMEKTLNEKKFILSQNSIIDEQVDAIVNPANEQLMHGGGVAGLISRTGGPVIQAESNLKRPIPTGQATFTGAGKLPFKYIIHTVGPIWTGGKAHEEMLLKSAVLSALNLASSLQLKSLSIPAISTGIFGYPLEEAIKTIFETIVFYLHQPTCLERIHLCEYSSEKAKEIKSIIEKYFPDND